MVSISFGPFSGNCLIENKGVVKQIQALPPSLAAASEARVWMHLREDGGIRFLRQLLGSALEDAGVLPSECLRRYREVHCYFPNISVWLGKLASDADVSVEYAGIMFPSGLNVPTASLFLEP